MTFNTLMKVTKCIAHIPPITQRTFKSINNTLVIYNGGLALAYLKVLFELMAYKKQVG